MILNKYQTYEQIQKRGYSLTAKVENEDGEVFFAKWLSGIKRNSQPSKILFDKLRHLKKARHSALPNIVEYEWDESNDAYCIIFEYKNAQSLEERIYDIKPTFFLKGMEQIINCLQQLQQNHRLSHGDITPANILVDDNLDFYLIDFGIADISSTLSQEQNLEIFAKEFAAPEKWNRKIPKGFPYQSDIYSIGKVTEWYFAQKNLPEYQDIKLLIDSACRQEPSNRINYNSLSESLRRITSTIVFDNENIVMVSYANKLDKLDKLSKLLLKELNDSKFKPRLDISPNNKKSETIFINIATKSFYCDALWLIYDQELKILSCDNKESQQRYESTVKKGAILNLPVNFVDNLGFYDIQKLNLTPFLKKIQKNKQQEGEYRKGKIEINKELFFFKELLEKELKVLEENSLRLRYDSFEKKGDFEIWFKIQENEKYSKNGHIFSHIDKATPPNPEEFEYILSQTADNKQMKEPLKFSGVAFDFNTKNRVLKFKDCERLDFEKIPKNGYLFENISKQEEEKKRQQEAIRKVEHNEVQNRDLIHFLFNPTDLQGKYIEQYKLEKVFQTDKEGAKFTYSSNQTRAIFNAIQREPLTVIQGPPGTGKTTVITEIVFQILNKNPDAKILITSQTNNAVDNVLDNLLEKEIPIVRLSGVRKPKQSLIKHTLERKIEGWKEEVKKKAQNEWRKVENNFLQKIEKEEENVLLKSIVNILIDKKDWKTQKAQIEKLEHIKGFENIKKSLQNQNTLLNALDKQTNCGILSFFNKRQIQIDWYAAISSLDENSSVNQKLIDSIRVIGATTNHIASKKYTKYNFEFDYVIMDESGKATTAEALIPIVLAEKLILVGDHRQLRPMLTANREVEKWLRNKYKSDSDDFDSWDDYFNRPSIFEQVITRIDEDFKSQLEECRRMPKDAVLLTSKCFYEPYNERIKPIQRTKDKEHNLDLKVDNSIIFLDIGNSHKSEIDGSGSSRNKLSASYIPKLLLELDKFEKVKDYSIGIITGYTAQLREIKKIVRKELYNKQLKRIKTTDIAISVVDKFQGLEKDIIIFDLVRSLQNTLGFLANANRINVALSRHKKLLIIIGNFDWLVQVKSNSTNGFAHSIPPLQKYLKMIKKEWIVKNIQQIF
ncbi:MAG TPA: AAA domain-containing protein [Bacteroidales bacterium]|nr:AAA domain-containing protein [Bacteroidales bacterium]HQB21392.1 AAA domain-containing protein [Bacteroidales bacterium]